MDDEQKRAKIKGEVRKILEAWATARATETLEDALVQYVFDKIAGT